MCTTIAWLSFVHVATHYGFVIIARVIKNKRQDCLDSKLIGSRGAAGGPGRCVRRSRFLCVADFTFPVLRPSSLALRESAAILRVCVCVCLVSSSGGEGRRTGSGPSAPPPRPSRLPRPRFSQKVFVRLGFSRPAKQLLYGQIVAETFSDTSISTMQYRFY